MALLHNTLRSSRLAATLVVIMSAVPVHAGATSNRYQQHNLVSDGALPADHTDPNLVNAWGIAFNPNGPVWVADNGTGVSTIYDGDGNKNPLEVTIPDGKPTGIVFNGFDKEFVVSQGNASGTSRFIFASENGFIDAWAPNVPALLSIQAFQVVDSSGSGAVYKGLALAGNGTGHFLYASDFHNRKIDVFDKDFKPAKLDGSFDDPTIPQDFAPFGIQNLNGDIYVTYAKKKPGTDDDLAGPGNGFVNVFDANGNLIRRVASHGKLNSPWGLAIAPANFGKFSNHLLVGNFGNGRINAFDPATHRFRGQLRDTNGKKLEIDGLWGIAFGNGVMKQSADVLFFAAGPNEEANGLYGTLKPE